MSLSKWSIMAVLLVGVYFSSELYGNLSQGWWFYAASFVSFVAALTILSISDSSVAWVLVAIELTAIIVIGFSYGQFVGKINGKWIYTNHEIIIESLAIGQALIMIIGVPWNGATRFVKQLGVGVIFWLKSVTGSLQAD